MGVKSTNKQHNPQIWGSMNGENQPLVADEAVRVRYNLFKTKTSGKLPIESIYRTFFNLMQKNQKMPTLKSFTADIH